MPFESSHTQHAGVLNGSQTVRSHKRKRTRHVELSEEHPNGNTPDSDKRTRGQNLRLCRTHNVPGGAGELFKVSYHVANTQLYLPTFYRPVTR